MEDPKDSAAPATGSLRRALFCTPVIPNAAGTGARQRAFTALRALQNRYAIHVLLIALTEEPAAEELAALRAPFSIATLDPPDWPPAALRKVPLATFFWESVLGDASSRDLQRLRIVPALDPAVPYDLTFYFRTRTAKFHDQLKRLAKVGGARVVYDMDDVESTVMERAVAMDAKRYGFEQRLRMRLGAKRLRRLERRLVRTSDVTFVCSEVDRQSLSS